MECPTYVFPSRGGASTADAAPAAAVQIRRELAGGEPLVLMHDMPHEDNAAMLALARGLGRTTIDGSVLSGHPLEDGAVYRIEARDSGVQDDDGYLIFSTTDSEFECHTDGFCRAERIDLVLMLCVRPAAQGGDSLIVRLPDVLARLDRELQPALWDPVFPAAHGWGAILFGSPGEPRVRFNGKEIHRLPASPAMGDRHWRAVRAFAALCRSADLQQRFRLAAGDCLIVDNQRALHGRTAFSGSDGRLLKRLWVNDTERVGATS